MHFTATRDTPVLAKPETQKNVHLSFHKTTIPQRWHGLHIRCLRYLHSCIQAVRTYKDAPWPSKPCAYIIILPSESHPLLGKQDWQEENKILPKLVATTAIHPIRSSIVPPNYILGACGKMDSYFLNLTLAGRDDWGPNRWGTQQFVGYNRYTLTKKLELYSVSSIFQTIF